MATLEPTVVNPDWHVASASRAAQLRPELPSATDTLPGRQSPIDHQDAAFYRNVARLGARGSQALDHAHGLGILHRDIKPANLLIDPHGALWITDFGWPGFPAISV